MFQDSVTIDNRHKRFVKTVAKTEIVYSLKNKKGYATTTSVQFEDSNGNPLSMLCFWSERARAKSCIINEWKKYNVVEIGLAEFLESWCIGMAKDDWLVGTQFDQNMFGYETDPLELILEIARELEEIRKQPTFINFDSLVDLKNTINEIIH